jgi:ABC-2 type transport system permease protein
MSAPSDTFDPAIAATPPAPSHAVRPFYWSVRRELWENRSLFVAPIATAAVVLMGIIVSMGVLSHWLKEPGSVTQLTAVELAAPFGVAAVLVTLAGFLVALFYSLGALHNERRDRSILFWKSMPVSDLLTVLSKAFVPLAVVPTITLGVVLVLHAAMLLVETVVLAAHGMGPLDFWGRLDLGLMEVTLVYGLVTAVIWYVPVYGWLFLVSGWARRVTFLWAILPPIGLCVFEQMALRTHHVANLLWHRLFGGADAAFSSSKAISYTTKASLTFHETTSAGDAMHMSLQNIDPLAFIGRPDVWVGIVVGAAFFGAAVWLRRYRDPI